MTSSIPTGAAAIAMLVFGIPTNFGSNAHEKLSHATWQRLDFVGAGMLLSGSVLLVTALVEANIRFAWSSGATITLFVLSTVSWAAFFAWEWFVTDEKRKAEPIFPWRFFYNRPWMGMVM